MKQTPTESCLCVTDLSESIVCAVYDAQVDGRLERVWYVPFTLSCAQILPQNKMAAFSPQSAPRPSVVSFRFVSFRFVSFRFLPHS